MGSIWSASAVTPAATDRIPVDVSSSGAPSRWTGQNVADAASRIGVTVNALGSINSNTTIDLANGAFVTATITGSLTFAFSNPPATGQGMQFVLILTNGGSAVVTWPGTVTWTGGTAPTLRASGVDVLRFYTSNGGTNWYGELAYDEQSIDAGAILTGTIDTARLGSGTANSGTFLRGDQTWAAPSGASPGGSDTQVQFNDGGVLAGDSGFTFNKTNNTVDLGGATVTASDPVLDLSQTWNNAAAVFTALKLNVTNTGSLAGSKLFDLQVGGSSVASFWTDGRLQLGANTSISGASGAFIVNYAGAYSALTVGNGVVTFDNLWSYGWGDLRVYRDAADTLAQRRTTNAQTFRVYRSYTDASNYSRWTVKWNTSTAILHAEGAGTGTDGSVAFNDAALATDATRGFLMIPSCAGTPTGTPADIPTGQAPIVYDSTNKKLCVWDGSAWVQTAALT